MTTEKVPDAKPIASGQAFIGLCATRANALTLYTNRIFQIYALNFGGLYTVSNWLKSDPDLKYKMILLLSLLVFFRHIYTLCKQIISGSARNVELWTKKLIQLEKTSQIEGGINLFSSLDYEAHSQVPTLPVNNALWFLKAIVIGWCMVGLETFIQILKEMIKWSTLIT